MPKNQKSKSNNAKPLVVKLKKAGISFEVLTKVGSMEPYREGKLSLDKVLEIEEIYKNASKFDKIKTSELKKAFQTDDKKQCILTILNEGTYPLSKKELQDKVNTKRDEIINYLHKYYQDPQKDSPHPISRFDSVLQKMKVNIDPHQAINTQIRKIVKRLPEFLPVKPINPPHLEQNWGTPGATNSGYGNGKGKGKGRGKKGGKRR